MVTLARELQPTPMETSTRVISKMEYVLLFLITEFRKDMVMMEHISTMQSQMKMELCLKMFTRVSGLTIKRMESEK